MNFPDVCPSCRKTPRSHPEGKGGWIIGCINKKCPAPMSVSGTNRAEALLEWNGLPREVFE